MSEAGIEDGTRIRAFALKGSREPDTGMGTSDPIPLAVQQQHGWRIAAHELDRSSG